MTKLHDKVNKRQLLREKLNCNKKPDDLAKILKLWISETESSVDLAHVLQSLQDNRKDSEQLPIRCNIIVKFTNKALQTNQAFDWLQAVDQLLQDYQEFGERVAADLYISKYWCLKSFKNFDPEAEDCLQRAIVLSKDNAEKIESYFVLVLYYEDISEYNKMKDVLLKCEALCTESLLTEDYLARTWVLLGHYYFRRFNFHRSRIYFNQARSQLELMCEQKTYKLLFKTLSECLHFIAKIYFEEAEFIKSASFYVKSQNVLEAGCKQNSLTLDIGATAFYHLRLGQVLEACQVKDSEKYHYDKSQKLFVERGGYSTSLVHVNLALANLIENESHYSSNLVKQIFQKEEKQIKDAATKSLKTGYPRGYLMSLIQMLGLYRKNRQIYLAIKVVVQILLSKEFHRLGGLVFLLTYVYKFLLKQYYKIKLIFYKTFIPNKILRTCPCPDPKCKLNKK